MAQKTDNNSDDILWITELLSQKWMMPILHSMCSCGSAMRFSDLEKSLPEINANILSQRLSELEKAELVTRLVSNEKPISVSYQLTKKAGELKKIFINLTNWSEKWK
jgi:DNA-binding HxlR family transcriptional regulator